MSRRADGSSLPKAYVHYFVKPWIDPVGFWSNEAKHAVHTLVDPIGHRVGHANAAQDALRDGRPVDAWMAFFVNDMWESADNQTEFAKRFYGIPPKKK